MKSIKMKDLKPIYKNLKEGEVILDVRRPEEYETGRVPGSINISHDKIEQEFEKIKKYQTVYVYCRSGNRVNSASQSLESLGIKNIIKVLDSGMPEWIEAGFEVES